MSEYLSQLKKVICFSFYLHSKSSLTNFLVSRREVCPARKRIFRKKLNHTNVQFCILILRHLYDLQVSHCTHILWLVPFFFITYALSFIDMLLSCRKKIYIMAYKYYVFISRGDGWVRSDKWALKSSTVAVRIHLHTSPQHSEMCCTSPSSFTNSLPKIIYKCSHEL